MGIAIEFTNDHIQERSQGACTPYSQFFGSAEPMASLIKNNPMLQPTYGERTLENARNPEDPDSRRVHNQSGGTLMVLGSHGIFTEAGSNGTIGAMGDRLRPINLEAKAGAIMLWDSRVLHGTGSIGLQSHVTLL